TYQKTNFNLGGALTKSGVTTFKCNLQNYSFIFSFYLMKYQRFIVLSTTQTGQQRKEVHKNPRHSKVAGMIFIKLLY
ncbi:hypothetical protein, partial [Prevotella sp.]|uniref:hypothetical protein n=1 Tax=Prevotella sp. TaxID=59823 RepID=UPI00307D4764